MEMQAHMSAGLSCGGSWSWPFMRRAVGMQGALSAATILQYISVVLEHRSGFHCRGLFAVWACSSRRLHLTMLVPAAHVPVPLRPSLTCRGEGGLACREFRTAHFEHVWALRVPRTYEVQVQVFLEHGADSSLWRLCCTAAWLPQCRASSSCSSGRAVNLDRGAVSFCLSQWFGSMVEIMRYGVVQSGVMDSPETYGLEHAACGGTLCLDTSGER